MEHIVQFAIGIDDDAITKRVEERAEKVIIDDIRKKVENAFFAKSYYGNPTNDPGECRMRSGGKAKRSDQWCARWAHREKEKEKNDVWVYQQTQT